MKQIPFVPNHKDNLHCANAVFRMIHQYYFGKDLSWPQIDKISHAAEGKGTWTFSMETYLAKKGLNVSSIEPVDYVRLNREGVAYLYQAMGEKTAKYFDQRSNIHTVLKYIPQYLRYVHHETRRASIEEVLNYLTQGSLVEIEVNADILNRAAGFDLHAILLYDYSGNKIIFHDPGLPPYPARIITISELLKCWHYPGYNGGIIVFSDGKTKNH